ncbi:hypothetical protein AAV35_012285 [Salimicrobium jeotgali]|uniref:DUF4396 domain-containing protein n=2 Tax=Salimicrobium TaxID=351195 RepID=K2GL13_9BACI|nr:MULTISPECIES: DUF4396 domain-containing protein [Salimicrobium]AKG05470.1 hypothetical protein AAV35_012285 [Salimicrobium jeotgali]EKE31064.1 hypothetical protein MJ3_10221 [Salimicrobium jeotgali]MBM7697379.1 hypothetical protein [Salimicrobium jeotgali]PBB05965.1 DUF4396 domain-containing protein [Salimicrobium humidisoli]
MLTIISWIALGIGLLSSLIIAVDVYRHPQMMKIMNVVWPINGWFFGPFALWTYYRWGRLKAKDNERKDERGKAAKVFLSTSHCSAGCTLGDAVGVPIVAVTGAAIAGSTLFAHYAVEFILAYGFGIVFQYLAIHPMSENNTTMDSLKASVKADSLSLIAFEIGMFGWMAIVHYLLFTEPPVPTEATYWFMMQIAMILGFITSYPANWWLVRKGIKEEM